MARAGVIGLSNAIFLAEAGYKVTIIAAHKPGDESIEYTSPWLVPQECSLYAIVELIKLLAGLALIGK